MSVHGRSGRGDAALVGDLFDPKWVRPGGQDGGVGAVFDAKWILRHRGSAGDCVDRYRVMAARAAADKLPGLAAAAPSLMSVWSDERFLVHAWHHLAKHGGDAPGPDGVSYNHLGESEIWKWARETRDDIRGGRFKPGPVAVRFIPKSSGRGVRQLVLHEIFDRVVQRAGVEVLQPLLDPLFDPMSFGFRPGKGPLRALAAADRLSAAKGPGYWVSADVRDAFPSVPLGRLRGVVRKYLPADDLVSFVGTVTRSDAVPGLPQGGPLSPLLLNLYLHHHLDRKWRRLRPDVPLIRFADDVLLLCRSADQARDAYAALVSLLGPAGLRVKEGETDAVRDVAGGQLVRWMGFEVGAAPGGLRFGVADEAWDGLADKFAAAQGRPNAPLAAISVLAGWVGDKAPCYPYTDGRRAYARIGRLAAAAGFDEIPDRDEVMGSWQTAYARWCKLRKRDLANATSA